MLDVLFLSEYNADTALIGFLLGSDSQVEHITGIHTLASQMKQTILKQPIYRVVGIIDNDSTNIPIYFDSFSIVNSWERITLKRHNLYDHYLIILDKAVESFILWNSQQVGLNVVDYGFSPFFRQYCKSLKPGSIQTNPDYLRLLTDLHARNAPGFVTLHQLLNDLITT